MVCMCWPLLTNFTLKPLDTYKLVLVWFVFEYDLYELWSCPPGQVHERWRAKGVGLEPTAETHTHTHTCQAGRGLLGAQLNLSPHLLSPWPLSIHIHTYWHTFTLIYIHTPSLLNFYSFPYVTLTVVFDPKPRRGFCHKLWVGWRVAVGVAALMLGCGTVDNLSDGFCWNSCPVLFV